MASAMPPILDNDDDDMESIVDVDVGPNNTTTEEEDGLSSLKEFYSTKEKLSIRANHVWFLIPSTVLRHQNIKKELASVLPQLRNDNNNSELSSSFTALPNAIIVPCSFWETFWRFGSSGAWIDHEIIRRLLLGQYKDEGDTSGGRIYNHNFLPVLCKL